MGGVIIWVAKVPNLRLFYIPNFQTSKKFRFETAYYELHIILITKSDKDMSEVHLSNKKSGSSLQYKINRFK